MRGGQQGADVTVEKKRYSVETALTVGPLHSVMPSWDAAWWQEPQLPSGMITRKTADRVLSGEVWVRCSEALQPRVSLSEGGLFTGSICLRLSTHHTEARPEDSLNYEEP